MVRGDNVRLRRSMQAVLIQRQIWTPRYFPTPQTNEVLNALSSLLRVQDKGHLLLIIAPSRSGSTTTLRKFAEEHPGRCGNEALLQTVVYVDSPPSSGVLRMVKVILRQYFPSATLGVSIQERIQRLKTYLIKCGTRILIVDHAHNLLAGTAAKVNHTLEFLVGLIEDTGISVVMAGSERLRTIMTNHVRLRSAPRVFGLKPFSYDSAYKKYLTSVIQSMPFDCRPIIDNPLYSSLFDKTGGLPGRIVDEVRKLAMGLAAENGHNRDRRPQKGR